MALMEACLELLRPSVPSVASDEAALSLRVPGAPFRMEAALARIRVLLAAKNTIPFTACLPTLPPKAQGRDRAARAAVASSFAAVLDLVRGGGAIAQQEMALGAMHIRDSGAPRL